MCTSIIISGKKTFDGRPLLLKHRDQRVENNRIEFVKGAKYDFLSLVNSNYTKGELSWCGVNNKGFSIISTASYNLGIRSTKGQSSPKIIYKALSYCKDTNDFELLLSKQIDSIIPTNFGIIDAFGGAAYYEVSSFSWKKLDVNDIKIAPNGYLVSTNFSRSGNEELRPGLNRFLTTEKIIAESIDNKVISPRWILNKISRTYKCIPLKIDLKYDTTNDILIDQDFISNYISVASVVFQGVKPNENPLHSVMWSVLGYPPLGVIVPLFLNQEIPFFMRKRENNTNCKICDLAVALKQEIFKIDPNNKNIITVDFDRIYSPHNDGFLQKIIPLENELLDQFEALTQKWRNFEVDNKAFEDFYKKYYQDIEVVYSEMSNSKIDYYENHIVKFDITDTTPPESIEHKKYGWGVKYFIFIKQILFSFDKFRLNRKLKP